MHAWNVKIHSEMMQGLLSAYVPSAVGMHQDDLE
jgi:hypothetical protein